jgi:hypothetical protein
LTMVNMGKVVDANVASGYFWQFAMENHHVL